MGTKLLKQTGLGEVFEDAVSPTLMYLPAVTPVEVSLELLPSAYEAMFVLGSVQYPRPVSGTPTQRGKEETENMKFYDRMMREGILRGYVHAQEYSGIVEILLQQLASLVERMGVYGVKHLKVRSPILSPSCLPFVCRHRLVASLNREIGHPSPHLNNSNRPLPPHLPLSTLQTKRDPKSPLYSSSFPQSCPLSLLAADLAAGA
jgi:hypothetical protein